MKLPSYILFLTLWVMTSLAQAFELTSAGASNSALKTSWNYKDSGITLYGPDNADKPIVWEGPLQINNKSQTRRYGIQLVDRLYVIDDVLFVLSYSGSKNYLDMINLASLSHRVKARSISSGAIEINKQTITIEPACECVENDLCHCNAAQVFNWNRGGITLNKVKSLALTKELLGDAFEGVKIIPKSSVRLKH